MRIGIKLEIGFSEHESYRRLYGNRGVVEHLRELGFDLVETPIGLETGTDALQDHVARCLAAGLAVSLHPYSENTNSNPAFFSPERDSPCRRLHQRLLGFAAETSRRQRAPTLVTIHPAVGGIGDSRRALVERSVAFFSWAQEWCDEHGPDVQVVAELQISPNPTEPLQRIGDTYDELLAIVSHSGVKACWDFGHAYLNAERYGVKLYPPDAFLQRVGHVHCHDVSGDDHHPLIFNTVPWQSFVRLLLDRGFDEAIILEVSAAGFLNAGGHQSLIRSFEALATWVDECRGSRRPPGSDVGR
jgi:sugar phosphate isomerase/epimerase